MSKHLQKELDGLQKKLLRLCTMVEEALRYALKAFSSHDTELAHEVIRRDAEIDNMEIEVEEECLKILALHQPVAVDLRFIVAVLKINNDLERIGDLAVNVAERGLHLATPSPLAVDFDFTDMFDKAIRMLRRGLDALVNWDAAEARAVCASDDEVDALHRRMFDLFKGEASERPRNIDTMLQYVSVSRHLERIADHATNIAEDVIYMTEGDIVRHKRNAVSSSC